MTTFLALVILISVAVGSIMLIMWTTGGETSDTPIPDESGSSHTSATKQGSGPHAPAVPTPTNEVYRAWWAMVRQVALSDWQSQSPTECATMAIDAGIDPELVTELTTLFRSVRYGDRPITDDVEQRASVILEQLQSQTPTGSGPRGGTDS